MFWMSFPAQKSCLKSLNLLVLLVSINLISGNFTLPLPQKPSVFAFGLPPGLVNVSLFAIPFQGTVQYDLLYGKTCPWVSDTECSNVTRKLSPVVSCHRVEKQNSTHIKRFSCVICNSTEKCRTMGIYKNGDMCLYFKVNVTTPIVSCRHICMQRNYVDILLIPPPKSVRLLATNKRELTVHWQRPPELKGIPKIDYRLLLKPQDHQSTPCIQPNSDLREHDFSYTFTALKPWANYSVTICCEFWGLTSHVNKSLCTCGGPKYIEGWPVFQRTLPEAPSKQPLLQPCEASCGDRYFSAVLKWKASEEHEWNGIPIKSVIKLWSDSQDQDENQFGAPVTSFSVPLAADFNGSLVTYTVHNLSIHSSYLATVQFCTQAGCGPNATRNLSCEKCELLSEPGTPDHQVPSGSPESHQTMIVSVVVSVVSVLVIAVAVWWCYRERKKRSQQQENIVPLEEQIGDVTPRIYEPPPSFTFDSGVYRQIPDTQSLLTDNQAAEMV